MGRTWHLITGEYPPRLGGVADYTSTLAAGLADLGSDVHVWAPWDAGEPEDRSGVHVHRVGGRYGPADLVRLGVELDRFTAPRSILVQYVPHAFGCKAMNLAFVAWVARRARRGDDVHVMFHEVAFPWVRRPLRRNLLAAVHRLMAAVLVRACGRAYVATTGWEVLLDRLGAGRRPIAWLPVPSNVPDRANPAAVVARRSALTAGDPAARVVAHFGTYDPTLVRDLGPALRAILDGRPWVRVLLLGAGAARWRATLADGRADRLARIIAPGVLPAAIVAEHLRACDLALQPYPDGASGRRGTLMASLANGVPVLTTLGAASEPVWSGGAVATVPVGDPTRLAARAIDLLDRPGHLAELGEAGRRLYEHRFAIRHTVAALMGPP